MVGQYLRDQVPHPACWALTVHPGVVHRSSATTTMQSLVPNSSKCIMMKKYDKHYDVPYRYMMIVSSNSFPWCFPVLLMWLGFVPRYVLQHNLNKFWMHLKKLTFAFEKKNNNYCMAGFMQTASFMATCYIDLCLMHLCLPSVPMII